MTATPAVTLDGLVERTGLSPTHVKIDVEGYEGAVLRGGRRLLTGEPPPLIFLELHNALLRERREDPGAVLDLLEELGYQTLDCFAVPADRAVLLARPLVRLIARPTRAGRADR
jgi:hypothetical protein